VQLQLEAPLGKSSPRSRITPVCCGAGLIVGERRGKWMWWKVVPSGSPSCGGCSAGLERRARTDVTGIDQETVREQTRRRYAEAARDASEVVPPATAAPITASMWRATRLGRQ